MLRDLLRHARVRGLNPVLVERIRLRHNLPAEGA
jgi:hypothetical protein